VFGSKRQATIPRFFDEDDKCRMMGRIRIRRRRNKMPCQELRWNIIAITPEAAHSALGYADVALHLHSARYSQSLVSSATNSLFGDALRGIPSGSPSKTANHS
jgi:hypothetical protein